MANEIARIERIRLNEDLSYRELGQAIGIEESALGRILRGERQPRDRSLHKMRRFLEERDAAVEKRKRAS